VAATLGGILAPMGISRLCTCLASAQQIIVRVAFDLFTTEERKAKSGPKESRRLYGRN
jgi:hypothetical protein